MMRQSSLFWRAARAKMEQPKRGAAEWKPVLRRPTTTPVEAGPGGVRRKGGCLAIAVKRPRGRGGRDGAVPPVVVGDSNPGWYGNIRGKVEASIARSKAVYSAIDSHALGGLKTRMVFANSTARQTEV